MCKYTFSTFVEYFKIKTKFCVIWFSFQVLVIQFICLNFRHTENILDSLYFYAFAIWWWCGGCGTGYIFEYGPYMANINVQKKNHLLAVLSKSWTSWRVWVTILNIVQLGSSQRRSQISPSKPPPTHHHHPQELLRHFKAS